MTAAEREATETTVVALLSASLEMWGTGGVVERDPAGVIFVRTLAAEVRVCRAPEALPFRWVVGENGRERGSGSVVGLLRHVRQALDAGYRPGRLRIAKQPEAL